MLIFLFQSLKDNSNLP